jgi:hypothetical protein
MESCKITDKQIILSFLDGTGRDSYGRAIDEILSWSDLELEQCHSQIQWVFPLHEESKHAVIYPILNKEIVEEAKCSSKIISNLLKSKLRFESFLGIGRNENKQRQNEWCKNHNHNLLRITRIIRSLRLFGLNCNSTNFYEKVTKVALENGISPITLKYWEKAYIDDPWATMLS